MRKFLLASFILCSLFPVYSRAENRLKNIMTVKGVRDNPIIGYGLVIGLNGTGDGGGEITNQSMTRMFQKLGLNPQQEIASKNVAAVIVTAKLPPFARVGQKIDITVSSIGDSSSLAGGTLLVTPLKGGDGEVYAVADGAISIGGIEKGKKFATTGRISGGAVVEKEIAVDFDQKKSLRFALNSPDFTTAARVERIINQNLGGKYAIAKDSGTIDLMIPPNYQRNVVELIAILENLKVVQDKNAKIVINERTGTLVAGGDLQLNDVAISHGDLVIEVKGGAADSGKGKSVHIVGKNTTLNELVTALNALGAGPEDFISIFQALKESGALVGELTFI